MRTYGEWRCSSTYSEPRHWIEVNIQLHTLASLFPVSIGKEAGWAPEAGLYAVEKRRVSVPSRNRIELPSRRLVTALEALNLLSLY
jgi:hypothetical protein